MRPFKLYTSCLTIICGLLLFSSQVQAKDWTLDNDSSSLAFVTTKIEHVPEVLSFASLSGSITADGSANLMIDVDGIDAIFDIRNERMKEFLFNMAEYPQISVTTDVDMEAVEAIPSGETTIMAITTTMSLLGAEHAVPAEVSVTNTGSALVVSSAKPVLLSATTLGLEEGVAKLAELAGGIQISRAVSVSFTLRFE